MSARRIAGGVGCSLALAAWLVLPLLAQWQAALTYRSRGRYSEGIRTAPSTGETLDLISALVDYREPYKDLPAAFRAMFYLPKQAPVYLAIREVEARYYYWLDMQPDPGWQAASANRFEWPTGTVIRSLKWKEGAPLSLDDLGATARLDSPDPGTMERVAPVAFYHSRPPQSVEGYCFVFRPGARMSLVFEILPQGAGTPLASQTFPSVLAGQPHTVRWNAKGWADGWYRLAVSGFVRSNNAKVDPKVVSFYHARRLGQ